MPSPGTVRGLHTAAEVVVKFAVLGPTEVWDGERLVETGPLRRRLLLAALLVDVGRVVPVETLLDRVWDGHPSDAARATLQTYVSRLRVTLGTASASSPALVSTSPRGYALDVGDDDVDARRFEVLLERAGHRRDDGDPASARALVGEALTLWRGEAYADFTAGFTTLEATRLHELRLIAHELATELDLELGRHLQVVQTLPPLIVAEPLREPLRAALMLALYRSGRPADALRVFDEGRSLLAEHLGLDPDVQLQQLQARILRQDPALDLAVPASVAPVAADTVREPTALDAERLVGRSAEVGGLSATLSRVATGATEFVALVGEAGMGKSRLAEELSRIARARGHVVAWGRCWQHEGAPALWPWRQVLRELATRMPDDVLADAMTGRAAAVATVVPELSPSGPDLGAPTIGSVDAAEVSTFDAVVVFLQAAARDRPVVIVVDDLQWADPASRRLTEYVATHLRGTPVAVLVTVRSPGHEKAHPDLDVLASLARLTRVRRIDLPPLTPADVRTLLAERVGEQVDEPTATALHTRTGGNPFFIGEIVRLVLSSGADTALTEGIPDTIRGVIRRRVQRLSEDDKILLRAAAVVGRTFDLDLLAALTGASEDDVDEAVDRATSLGLLRSEPGSADQHRFTHALLQETLLDETGPARRARLHRRVADCLVDRRAEVGHARTPAQAVAHHFEQAGGEDDLARAVEFYLLANDEAFARRAWSECRALLEQAVEVADRLAGTRAGALRAAATSRLRSFHTMFEGAHSSFGRWADGAVDVDHRTSARDVVTQLHAWWADLHGRNRLLEADAVSRKMAELAESGGDPLLGIAAHLTHGNMLIQQGRYPDARDSFAAAGPLLHGVDIPALVFLPDPRVASPLFTAVCDTVLGDDNESAPGFAAARRAAAETGDPVGSSYVDGMWLFTRVWRGDAVAARDAASVVDHSITANGMEMMRPYMVMPAAWAEATVDPRRGAALADAAMSEVAEHEALLYRPHFLGMYAEVLTWVGRYDDALERLDAALTEAATSGAHGYDAALHRVRADVLRATGHPRHVVEAEVARGVAMAQDQRAGLFLRRLLYP
ncbi:BTAD domain-containing putative transcriptional regulator [Jatrophihabitans sp. YIM 134969]